MAVACDKWNDVEIRPITSDGWYVPNPEIKAKYRWTIRVKDRGDILRSRGPPHAIKNQSVIAIDPREPRVQHSSD